MRNSSYLTRRNNAKRKDAAEIREEVAVDASEAAQLLMIEKTFLDITSQDVNQLQHPNPKKRHLKVVEVSSCNQSNNYVTLHITELRRFAR